MTESEYLIERAHATDELIRRLMLLISYSLPALQPQISDLWQEYQRVLTTILKELKDDPAEQNTVLP
jgi:hypothetical protein